MSLLVARSSFGYSMLLHSRQKRKVICSWILAGGVSAEAEAGEGEAMGCLSVGCGGRKGRGGVC